MSDKSISHCQTYLCWRTLVAVVALARQDVRVNLHWLFGHLLATERWCAFRRSLVVHGRVWPIVRLASGVGINSHRSVVVIG